MKISISQPQLLKSLQMVEHAVNDRSTLPILANVLLQINENKLILTTTDLDVGIQCQFPLTQANDPGAVALPARKLATIVRELPDELILLEAKKNHTATLNCGTASFRIPGLPPEDFPVLPKPGKDSALTLPAGALKSLVSQTSYAMSTEETRFILNGALLVAEKQTLTMVATDGRRLALATAVLSSPVKEPLQVVLPAKTIRELGRLLRDEEIEEANISLLQDNQLAICFGVVTMVSRLLEGQFPQYDKVIPAPSKTVLICDRQMLANAIKRVSLMTTATSQAVVFEIGKDKLVVSKESSELGSAREELVVSYHDEDLTIAFNPEFWLDVLKILNDEKVTIEFSGADRPAVIRIPASSEARSGEPSAFIYLVLPMKVA